MGTGFFLYGHGGPEADGTWLATEFVTLVFFPLVPWKTMRVRAPELDDVVHGGHVGESSQRYVITAREPLAWGAVAAVYLKVWLGVPLLSVGPIVAIGALLSWIQSQGYKLSGEVVGSYLIGSLIYLVVCLAYLLGRARRWKS